MQIGVNVTLHEHKLWLPEINTYRLSSRREKQPNYTLSHHPITNYINMGLQSSLTG